MLKNEQPTFQYHSPNRSVSFPGPFLELMFLFPFVMITAPPMPRLWSMQICIGKRSKGHEASSCKGQKSTENSCGSPGCLLNSWNVQTRALPTLSCSSGPGRNSTLKSLNACFEARRCSSGFAFFIDIVQYHLDVSEPPAFLLKPFIPVLLTMSTSDMLSMLSTCTSMPTGIGDPAWEQKEG